MRSLSSSAFLLKSSVSPFAIARLSVSPLIDASERISFSLITSEEPPDEALSFCASAAATGNPRRATAVTAESWQE
jgi:hypothetical protein